MLTDDEKAWLAKINTRETAATSGPWNYKNPTGHDGEADVQSRVPPYDMICAWSGCALTDENARFIAHARTDIPRLLVLVRQLEERVADLEKINNQLCVENQALQEENETLRIF